MEASHRGLLSPRRSPGWYAREWIEPEHCYGFGLKMPPHVAYMYKGFTHPSFRGQGAADDRYLFWMQYLLDRGKRSAVAYFSFDNLATLTRVRKLGRRRLGTITLLGVGRYRRVVVSDGLSNRRRRPLTTR